MNSQGGEKASNDNGCKDDFTRVHKTPFFSFVPRLFALSWLTADR
jgi:hypothetical protein